MWKSSVSAEGDREQQFTTLYDAIDHDWLMRFVEHRVSDRRVRRHIKKWLNAGVLEEGTWRQVEEGVPRNGPALASFRYAVVWRWWRSLQRRSQRHRSRRKLLRRFKLWVAHFIPAAHILQPYPEQRLRVMTRGRSPVG